MAKVPALSQVQPEELLQYSKAMLRTLHDLLKPAGYGMLAHLLELAEFEANCALHELSREVEAQSGIDMPDHVN
jgi:hypothetical protein